MYGRIYAFFYLNKVIFAALDVYPYKNVKVFLH